jgi:hypothetical protein
MATPATRDKGEGGKSIGTGADELAGAVSAASEFNMTVVEAVQQLELAILQANIVKGEIIILSQVTLATIQGAKTAAINEINATKDKAIAAIKQASPTPADPTRQGGSSGPKPFAE